MSIELNKPEAGWNFDNSYLNLPDSLYTKVNPVNVANPSIVIVNETLANDLGFQLEQYSAQELAQIFSGNDLLKGAEPIAQAYAGHQFGHFNILGDGRAHLLGEHITVQGKRFDIQLKGSGKTPYARRGDGRAALGPMLREYIISEAMFTFGIPTTRSLAVVTTGEPIMREMPLQGAILTRIASSHIRVGTFEYMAHKGNKEELKQLADYTINRHFSHIANSNQPYLDLLIEVMDKQINLITQWLQVGFIHGVMNTDNVAISGETIDYGPCAFMDIYDPQTVFSSIDHTGRYAYANQPQITGWNLAQFASALLPLINEDHNKAISLAEDVLNSFNSKFQSQWLSMMRDKLGLFTTEKDDEKLISELLKWMQINEVDYTNGFRRLSEGNLPEDKIYQGRDFTEWYKKWQERLSRNNKPINEAYELMRSTNPAYIPRNYLVENALKTAENGDFSVFKILLEVLKDPYSDKPKYEAFKQPPKPQERVCQTYCGT